MGNPESVRQLNRALILRVLGKGRPVSRIEIAKTLGISKMTISVIVGDLIQEGLVDEVGRGEGAKNGGRKPGLLTMGQDLYVMGFDIGLTNTSAMLMNLTGKIFFPKKFPTQPHPSAKDIVKKTAELAAQAREERGIRPGALLGIGVSAAGLVERGRVLFSPDFHWQEEPLQDLLEEAAGVSCVVDNCTRAMALGEIWQEGRRQNQTLLFVNVGYGIGSALFLNGQIYKRNSEFGHVRVSGESILCSCGKEGCLEALSSGQAIERQAAEIWGSPLSAKQTADLAKNGDIQAQKIFKNAGDYLGRAIAMAVNLFNPSRVIIGGGVAQAGELLMEPLRESFNKDTMRVLKDTTSIEQTKLGMESGIRGAAALAMDSFVFKSALFHEDSGEEEEKNL